MKHQVSLIGCLLNDFEIISKISSSSNKYESFVCENTKNCKQFKILVSKSRDVQQ